jgi:hypothetical protein
MNESEFIEVYFRLSKRQQSSDGQEQDGRYDNS